MSMPSTDNTNDCYILLVLGILKSISKRWRVYTASDRYAALLCSLHMCIILTIYLSLCLQTKLVHVYRLVTMGSIEERIVQRAQKKLFLDGMVNRGSTAQGQAADDAALRDAAEEELGDEKEGDDAALDKVIKEDKASVVSFLRFGWNSVFSHKQPKIKGHNSESSATEVEDESDELTYEDIDLIIDRTRGSASTTGPATGSGDNTATTTSLQPTSSSSSSSVPVQESDTVNTKGDSGDNSNNKEQRFQKLMERQEKYLNSFDELEAFVPITG